ncbi:MAG: AMP-binding protein, partial [Thiomargarita sp.]|nr:AMP-binding protein [Thiomargarita sp.]
TTPRVHAGKESESLENWKHVDNILSKPPYSWQEHECAVILFTSGSTGIPKGVCHSMGNMLRSAKRFVEHFQFSNNDHLCCFAPIHTVSGLRSLVCSLISPVQVTLYDDKNASFLSNINKIKHLKPTNILCGPVFIAHLAAYGHRLLEEMQGVDSLLCAGSDLNEIECATVKRIFGISVGNYYGLTETFGFVLAAKINQNTSHQWLAPCEGVKISLSPFKHSKTLFQLTIIGENSYLGYLGAPLFRKTSIDTGDLVQKNSNGLLKLMGRSSGIVKAPNTEWIFPYLVEQWLKHYSNIINDVVVKGCKIVGGYGIEIWIDSLEPLNLSEMDQCIVNKFGSEYKPIKWHYATIKRTSVGKIDHIIENPNRP